MKKNKIRSLTFLMFLSISPLASCNGGGSSSGKNPEVLSYKFVDNIEEWVLDVTGQTQDFIKPTGKLVHYHFFNDTTIPYLDIKDFF